ncbi:MAG: DUF2141 domain-containing protein [Caulobacteraceae bacterium]|nr:DUF2141 domain-containing protein [Caulobacteraceae bacterium]
MKPASALLAALFSTAAGSALAADVNLTVTGVEARGGQMLVSLQGRDQFMKPTGAAGTFAPATGGTMVLAVKDVPPGDYAVTILHDEDSSWSMARKPDGRPAEGYAMSGKPTAGRAPTFDEVKITVPASGASLSLPIAYPRP